VFPWAHFRTTKAAVKAHTLLDLRGSIPTFVALTSAKVHDVLALHWIPLEPRSILTMDRACNDSDRLYRIHRIPAFFVVRPKKNLRVVVIFEVISSQQSAIIRYYSGV